MATPLDAKDELLSLQEVLDQTTLSRATLYREMRAGEFPPPVRIAAGKQAWLRSEVQTWFRMRLSER